GSLRVNVSTGGFRAIVELYAGPL
ncbi:MAG: hypothetical protein FD152_3236, partial [Xanthobacteraceae bacterium]